MTAKDYLTALKVIREIQRKQAYCSGTSQPFSWCKDKESFLELPNLLTLIRKIVTKGTKVQ